MRQSGSSSFQQVLHIEDGCAFGCPPVHVVWGVRRNLNSRLGSRKKCGDEQMRTQKEDQPQQVDLGLVLLFFITRHQADSSQERYRSRRAAATFLLICARRPQKPYCPHTCSGLLLPQTLQSTACISTTANTARLCSTTISETCSHRLMVVMSHALL